MLPSLGSSATSALALPRTLPECAARFSSDDVDDVARATPHGASLGAGRAFRCAVLARPRQARPQRSAPVPGTSRYERALLAATTPRIAADRLHRAYSSPRCGWGRAYLQPLIWVPFVGYPSLVVVHSVSPHLCFSFFCFVFFSRRSQARRARQGPPRARPARAKPWRRSYSMSPTRTARLALAAVAVDGGVDAVAAVSAFAPKRGRSSRRAISAT